MRLTSDIPCSRLLKMTNGVAIPGHVTRRKCPEISAIPRGRVSAYAAKVTSHFADDATDPVNALCDHNLTGLQVRDRAKQPRPIRPRPGSLLAVHGCQVETGDDGLLALQVLFIGTDAYIYIDPGDFGESRGRWWLFSVSP